MCCQAKHTSSTDLSSPMLGSTLASVECRLCPCARFYCVWCFKRHAEVVNLNGPTAEERRVMNHALESAYKHQVVKPADRELLAGAIRKIQFDSSKE